MFASPLARRIAAQKGLDMAQITGTGPRGRIVKADVEGVTAAPTQAAAPAAAPAPSAAPAAAPTGPSADTIAKMYADRDYDEIP
ncbi:MAG: E3 binding domain-containing protein, partial [Ketobacter sp.]